MLDLYLKYVFDVNYIDFMYFIFENYFKMLDSENDLDEWFDVEYFDDLGVFDLVYVNENERNYIEWIIDDCYFLEDEDNW